MQTPMDKQKHLNDQLEEFKKQNPQIIEAMRVLHMDLDKYLRTLAQMTPPTTSVTNTTVGA